MKNKFHFLLMIIAATLLNTTTYACIGSHVSCTSTCGTTESLLHVVDFENATIEEPFTILTDAGVLASGINVTSDFNNFLISPSLITRDNTRVESVAGLSAFFVGALKKVAIWGGVKLTKWVLGKIKKRANTYEYWYNQGDRGIIKAANHWNDLLQRSGCGGREPDHDPETPGFQDAEDCPLCSKQLDDLETT